MSKSFEKTDRHTLAITQPITKKVTLKQLHELKKAIKLRKQSAIAKFDSDLAEIQTYIDQCELLGVEENPHEKLIPKQQQRRV